MIRKFAGGDWTPSSSVFFQRDLSLDVIGVSVNYNQMWVWEQTNVGYYVQTCASLYLIQFKTDNDEHSLSLTASHRTMK